MKRARGYLAKACYYMAFYNITMLLFFAAPLQAREEDQARIYTDEQLFSDGLKFYDKGDWMRALMHLYAYEQRSPSQFKTNPSHAKQVDEAVIYLIEKITSALKDCPQSRPGTSVSGIQKPPPRLDPLPGPRLQPQGASGGRTR
jgi:hypothetical protein